MEGRLNAQLKCLDGICDRFIGITLEPGTTNGNQMAHVGANGIVTFMLNHVGDLFQGLQFIQDRCLSKMTRLLIYLMYHVTGERWAAAAATNELRYRHFRERILGDEAGRRGIEPTLTHVFGHELDQHDDPLEACAAGLMLSNLLWHFFNITFTYTRPEPGYRTFEEILESALDDAMSIDSSEKLTHLLVSIHSVVSPGSLTAFLQHLIQDKEDSVEFFEQCCSQAELEFAFDYDEIRWKGKRRGDAHGEAGPSGKRPTGLSEKMVFTRLGIPGQVGGPNPHVFFPYAELFRQIVAYLVGRLEPDFILRPDIRAEARRLVIRLASHILNRNWIREEALDVTAAQLRADTASQRRLHRELSNTCDHVLNQWAGVGEINHSFKSRFAAAVVIEDIFRDTLDVSFVFNLHIPFAIENQDQLPLTLALTQVWRTCSRARGYQRFVNYLRLVQSAIAPGTLVEFEDTLGNYIDEVGGTLIPREEQLAQARRQLERCVRESGVDD
jgi:hypothetical protein